MLQSEFCKFVTKMTRRVPDLAKIVSDYNINVECYVKAHGNFTIAVIYRLSPPGIMSVGVAKRNPNVDEPNAERGVNISVCQALRNLIKG